MKLISCAFDFKLPDGQVVMVCFNVNADEWAIISTEGKPLYTKWVESKAMNEEIATSVIKEYLSTQN